MCDFMCVWYHNGHPRHYWHGTMGLISSFGTQTAGRSHTSFNFCNIDASFHCHTVIKPRFLSEKKAKSQYPGVENIDRMKLYVYSMWCWDPAGMNVHSITILVFHFFI